MKNTLRWLGLALALPAVAHSQDAPLTWIDLYSAPQTKAYNSTVKKYNIWDRMDHACGTNRSDQMLSLFGADIPRRSQGHLEAMALGNARIACVSLSPIQTQLLNGKLLNNANRKETISCLFGIDANEVFLRQRDRNYFDDLTGQILFLQRFAEKQQTVGDLETWKYNTVGDGVALDLTMLDLDKIGLVLSIDGGHALGNSVYIDGGIANGKEYEELVLRNCDKLKGVVPLLDNTDAFMKTPVLSIALAKSFENGIVGGTQIYNDKQIAILGVDPSIGKGFTELGKSVVRRLLDEDRGRKILIDIRHMSPEGKKWLYQYWEKEEIQGKNFPIIATGVGISGLSSDNPAFLLPDTDAKNVDRYNSIWQQNLSNEDVIQIVRSKGIIGVSLDEQVLGGSKYFADLSKTVVGTAQRREVQIKLLVAQLLSAANCVNDVRVWNHLAIGSGFDTQLNSMDAYETSENLGELARDLEAFFNNPKDVFNLFTATDVKRLMFGQQARALVHKLCSDNAANFLRTNLNKGAKNVLPPPSIKGNVEFRLSGDAYKSAEVVSIAGDFNEWIADRIIMARDGDEWYCKTNLKPGIYQYKIVIDGRWIVDPNNPDFKEDGNGNRNSIKTVR